jgi:catechol 2,3-dioxygenase-like lactoylglutathione lyase family enzyme
MKLTNVHHAGIASRDPSASDVFYRTVLGFEPLPTHERGELTMLQSGSARLTIHAASLLPEWPRGEHLAFGVDASAAEIARALAGSGIAFEPVGNRIYLHDPDGRTIELVAAPVDSLADVRHFLEHYEQLYEQRQADAIAECFAYPLHVASDGQSVGLFTAATKDAWIPTIRQLLARYERLGVSRARQVELTMNELTAQFVHAKVRWVLEDRTGSPIDSFSAAYTIARFQDRLRIVALAHDETIENYR